jgi:hypothetical protein
MAVSTAESPQARRTDLLPALIGMAGVLIGALATSGIAYLGDRNARIADERTAKRLVAAEIRFDTNRALVVSVLGRLAGKPPRTVEWSSQASNLARYLPAGDWTSVSRFYDDLLNIQPSLSQACVTTATRRFATTVAKEGDIAYVALGNASIPSLAQIGTSNPCR